MTADPHGNPYRPPRAPVADLNDAPPAVRPRLVDVAVVLIGSAVIAGYLNSLLQFRDQVPGSWVPAFAGAVVGSLVLGFITYRIWQGSNGARIVMLVIFLATLGVSAIRSPAMFQMTTAFSIVFVVRLLVLLAALGMLFLTPARRWFSRPPRATS